MTVPTYAEFIAVFDEFADQTQAKIDFWLTQGSQQINETRFGTQYSLGVMLYAAHNIALRAQASENKSFGGPLGRTVAPINNESVDKVSVGYSPDLSTVQNAGVWNATSYGQQLYQMFRTYNLGPVYRPGPRRPISIFGWPVRYLP